MSLGVVAGTANPVLAEAVARVLGTRLVGMRLERFPDGEICPCPGPAPQGRRGRRAGGQGAGRA
jgi:hypothetical protein